MFPSHRFTHSVTLFSRCYFSVNCFYLSNGVSVTRQVVTNFINCFNVRGLRSYVVVLEQGRSDRRIFVYTFCLINICLSLSDDANKIKTLNIERE